MVHLHRATWEVPPWPRGSPGSPPHLSALPKAGTSCASSAMAHQSHDLVMVLGVRRPLEARSGGAPQGVRRAAALEFPRGGGGTRSSGGSSPTRRYDER